MVEAISLAKELNDVNALAYALGWATDLACCERNGGGVDRLASELIELCTRHGFVHWLAVGAIWRGWARSACGDAAEGIPWIERGSDCSKKVADFPRILRFNFGIWVKACLENGRRCETPGEAHPENGKAERRSLGKPRPLKLPTRSKGQSFPRFPSQYWMEKVFPRRYLARGSGRFECRLHYSVSAKAKPHLSL